MQGRGGVEADSKEAVHWLRRAAKAGYTRAIQLLAQLPQREMEGSVCGRRPQ